MRRSHRTGAVVAAAATMLTGAGFAVASLEPRTVPTQVDVVSDTRPAGGDESLDATLDDLRGQAHDLTTEISDRERAARLEKERDRAARDTAAGQADPTTAAGTPPGTPATDATTGASGSVAHESEESDESDEGGRGSGREGDDD